MSNNNFSYGINNPPPIPKAVPVDTELFGEFKSAQSSKSQQSEEFLQLNNKLDNVLYQISLLRAEIKDIKQQYNPTVGYPANPRNIIYPAGPSYHPIQGIPSYPGQPMPPYPHQQMLYGNNNQHFNK
jgi:hypothetical protein